MIIENDDGSSVAVFFSWEKNVSAKNDTRAFTAAAARTPCDASVARN
jgi:hypothetical protein